MASESLLGGIVRHFIVQQTYYKLAKILAMGKSYRMRGRMVAVIVFPSKVDADEWMGIEERRMRELSTFLSTFFVGTRTCIRIGIVGLVTT